MFQSSKSVKFTISENPESPCEGNIYVEVVPVSKQTLTQMFQHNAAEVIYRLYDGQISK